MLDDGFLHVNLCFLLFTFFFAPKVPEKTHCRRGFIPISFVSFGCPFKICFTHPESKQLPFFVVRESIPIVKTQCDFWVIVHHTFNNKCCHVSMYDPVEPLSHFQASPPILLAYVFCVFPCFEAQSPKDIMHLVSCCTQNVINHGFQAVASRSQTSY